MLDAFDDLNDDCWSDDDDFSEGEEENLRIVVIRSRQDGGYNALESKEELSVPQGTTVEELKKTLSKIDLSGPITPSEEIQFVGLKTPGAADILPDSAVLSANTCILEIIPSPSHVLQEPEPRNELSLPYVDVATPAGTFGRLYVDNIKECTVGRFKEMLQQGELSLKRKMPHANKLSCYAMIADVAGPALKNSELLPQLPAVLAVSGPTIVLKELETLLHEKLGSPDRSRPSTPMAETASLQADMPLPLMSGKADNGIAFFYLGRTGNRDYMEDRSCAVLQIPGCEENSGRHASLFGVFDGHGGDQVADLVARGMPQILGAQLSEDKDPAVALQDAFAVAEMELRGASNGKFDIVGTTAITVLLQRETDGKQPRLFCANCGDSRAVLCRKGEAVDLSSDHNTRNPTEEQRVLDAGGRINRGRLQMPRGGDAGLTLTRALGDFGYKEGASNVLICQPEVMALDIGPEDEFVALGSDGIFDFWNSSDLVSYLRQALERGDSLGRAVESVVEQSLAAGDNATLCVVRFNPQ